MRHNAVKAVKQPWTSPMASKRIARAYQKRNGRQRDDCRPLRAPGATLASRALIGQWLSPRLIRGSEWLVVLGFVNHHVAAAAFAPDAQQGCSVLQILGHVHGFVSRSNWLA